MRAFELNKSKLNWDFPGGPVVKTLYCQCKSEGSITGWGTKIPHAAWPEKKKGTLNTVIFEIDNQQEPTGTQHNVMWQAGWEGSLGENESMYRYG